MRWDNLRLSDESAQAVPDQDGLFGVGDVMTRTFDTPEFRGMTFYEVRARSILNKVPAASRMPFSWTLNPYRGCSHACSCFARRTHEYLDLDAGIDFDSKIVVKINAPDLLRKELTSSRWAGNAIAMGTNVDPYQRAEGRYRLMAGILEALRDARNPFSILTKGTLVLRDLDLLREAAEVTDVSVNVSVGFVDEALWRQVEPGTPAPPARLSVCRTLTDAGIGCGVLMAPILPYLTDSPSQLEATVWAIAAAGARSVTPLVLHLRPGARAWYLAWLNVSTPNSFLATGISTALAPTPPRHTSAMSRPGWPRWLDATVSCRAAQQDPPAVLAPPRARLRGPGPPGVGGRGPGRADRPGPRLDGKLYLHERESADEQCDDRVRDDLAPLLLSPFLRLQLRRYWAPFRVPLCISRRALLRVPWLARTGQCALAHSIGCMGLLVRAVRADHPPARPASTAGRSEWLAAAVRETISP